MPKPEHISPASDDAQRKLDTSILATEYDLGTIKQIEALADGGYASVYKIVSSTGMYALRIAPETPQIVHLEDQIRQIASQNEQLAVRPSVPTKSGMGHLAVDGIVWRVTPFIQGKALSRTADAAQLQQAAAALATFHDALAELGHQPDTTTPDYRHLPIVYLADIDVARKRVSDIISKLETSEISNTEQELFVNYVLDERDFILSQFDLLSQHTEGALHNLPITVAHGDYWHNNILCNDDGILTGIIDFGMSGRSQRIDDFAGHLVETPLREPDIGKLQVFLKAYQQKTQTKLTPQEIALLPEEFRRFNLQEIFYELYVYGTAHSSGMTYIQPRVEAFKRFDDHDWPSITTYLAIDLNLI